MKKKKRTGNKNEIKKKIKGVQNKIDKMGGRKGGSEALPSRISTVPFLCWVSIQLARPGHAVTRPTRPWPVLFPCSFWYVKY